MYSEISSPLNLLLPVELTNGSENRWVTEVMVVCGSDDSRLWLTVTIRVNV